MNNKIVNSIVQGIVSNLKPQICDALGLQNCCNVIAVRYQILSGSNDIDLSIRVRADDGAYYDILVWLDIGVDSPVIANFDAVVASDVNPESSLTLS
ncbi:hypothetical protein ACOME3_000062 [Neoechinorhynchus agilis]